MTKLSKIRTKMGLIPTYFYPNLCLSLSRYQISQPKSYYDWKTELKTCKVYYSISSFTMLRTHPWGWRILFRILKHFKEIVYAISLFLILLMHFFLTKIFLEFCLLKSLLYWTKIITNLYEIINLRCYTFG